MKLNSKFVIIRLILIVLGVFCCVYYVGFYTHGVSNMRINTSIVTNYVGTSGLVISPLYMNKTYLMDVSDYIIEGVAVKSEARYVGDTIYTFSNISVKNIVKGDFKANAFIIKTVGGCIGTVCMQVTDQPIFHEGKNVRIYMREIDGEITIVGGLSGVEELETT